MGAVETGSEGGAAAATVGGLLDAATERIARGRLRGAARRRRGAGRRRARGRASSDLSRDGSGEPPPEVVAAIEAAVARRAEHEPLAYVLGRAPFRGLEIAVDPRVLWPRRETELLVEVADRAARGRPRARGRDRLGRDRPGADLRAPGPARHRLRPLARSGRSGARERRAARAGARGQRLRGGCPTGSRASTW